MLIRCVMCLLLLVAAGLGLFAARCGAQTSPTIQITSVPAFGAWPGYLSGRVLNVNPAAYRVAALVFISGLGFYSKPYCNATTTPLAADGSFTVLLTTGGIDHYATIIAVLVVPAAASVPCYAGVPGIPLELEQQAVAELLIPRPNPNQREIQFAGETWVVKSSPAPVGPGPNNFSDSQDNVWVDNLGRLHLRITNRSGGWYCAEVVSKRVIGYGRYAFQIDTVPQFDKNVVFGAFSYADAERISSEIDVLELGRFGNQNDPNNAQYVVQPWGTPGNRLRFLLPSVAPTVHSTTWLKDSLHFRSFDAFGTLLNQWAYGGQPPATGSERLNFRFNLWLLAPPSNGQETEIVISRFSYAPITAPDLIWQEDASRAAVVWYMGGGDGSTYLSGKWLTGGVPGWKIAASGDFDGNGTPDLVWQEDTSRAAVIWYMGGADGSMYLWGKWLIASVPGWRVVAAGDFDGNGKPDLIWQEDATRAAVVWYMGGADGSTYLSGKGLTGGVAGWRVVAAADFDGNGTPDLVWQEDASRAAVIWYMGGADGSMYLWGKWLIASVPGWRVAAAGDFDGNGKPDLIWQEDISRGAVIWYMGGADGATYLSGKWLGEAAGWRVVACGDFDGSD